MEENKEEVIEKEEVVEVQEDTTKQELEEMTDRYKRLMAEFDNFKKRSSKERESLYNSLMSDIITSILPVVDNLEKAAAAPTEDENYKQGVEMVHKQLIDTLSGLGVEEIKTVGETFNPEYHEAVSSVEDETLGEKEIKEEFRKGYKIKEKVIRHSMVVVAN
ncbi:MAG: nucleotide exchange factor GrpE [Clostridia bacterium]|nr:nucleotide exchange factor GrpE [Clostridia bacterium]